MHKKRILRTLPVLILTFFIIIFVDFKLRTLPKLNAIHISLPNAFQRSIQEAPSSAKGALNPVQEDPSSAKGASNSVRSSDVNEEIDTGRNRLKASERRHATPSPLKLTDIFIAVKTTGRFHKTRLVLLLETWISRTKAHVSVSFYG